MAKGIVTVDINKAKEMYKNTLRAVRQPLLEKLDIEFMRAVETGNTAWQSEIAEKKQTLRDITDNPDIDKAKKTDDLRKMFPEILMEIVQNPPPPPGAK